MPQIPEQVALRKNWAEINSTLANQVDLAQLGNTLVQRDFLPQQSVSSILSVKGDSDLAKVGNLLTAVQSRITTARPVKAAQYYKELIRLVHHDLQLTDLANEMVDTCKKCYDQQGIVYRSPLDEDEVTVLPSAGASSGHSQSLRARPIRSTTSSSIKEANRNRRETQNKQRTYLVCAFAGICCIAVIVRYFYTTGEYGKELSSNEGSAPEASQMSFIDLSKELKDIGNWELLCTYLGVENAIIEEIKHSGTIAPEKDCLTAYLDSGNASWKHVVRVVCGHPFYKTTIGLTIAKKYNVPLTACNRDG